jgi:hypothetical protein
MKLLSPCEALMHCAPLGGSPCVGTDAEDRSDLGGIALYLTLGIFLIMAARNPSANRSLIAFTAWSSFAHAAVTSFQAFRNLIAHEELIGSAVLVVIG